MKNKLLLLLIFFFQLSVFSQPTIQWQKCFGGTHGDAVYSIQQTSDGGYIIAGVSESNDGNVSGHHGSLTVLDLWIVKIDISENIQWQKSLGGSSSENEPFVQQTTDGGYIVSCKSESNDGDVVGSHGYWDCWIIKLNNSGSILWQKCLGGSDLDVASSIQETNDGGYIMAGSTDSNDGDVSGVHGSRVDYWVVKLAGSGNIQWQKCFGGSGDDYTTSIRQTSDGGYIIAGNSTSNDGNVSGNHGSMDCWIVKLNSAGTLKWQKSLGGSSFDGPNSIYQTLDSGYIVAGSTWSNDGDVSGHHTSYYNDYWVVKLDSSGNIKWQNCLGGSGNDIAFSIQQTNDRSYIVAGTTNSNDGDVSGNHGGIDSTDYWIVKLDTIGNIEWQKCLGGSLSSDGAKSIKQTNDGGFIVAGSSASNDGDVGGNHGQLDYWIVKLSAPVGVDDITSIKNFNLYPNPTTNHFTLSLTEPLQNAEAAIYNMLGKEMLRKKLTGDRMEIERGSLVSGVYVVRVVSEEKQWVEKVVVE